MTLRNGLFFENNKTNQHAQDVRLMLKGLLGGVTGGVAGVGGATHFKVTEKAGTPDMSVDVAAGHLFIEGSRNSAQGTYHLYNDATVNVPLSASDPTNPRIDIVYVRVRDSAYDAGFTGDDDAEIVVAEGTPAAVPVAPTITDEDYIELARVTVGAGVSAVENADITDLRVASSVWSAPRGEVAYAQRTSDTPALTNGVDVPDMTVDVDVVAGRKYKVTFDCYGGQQAGSGDCELKILEDGSIVTTRVISRSAAATPFPLHAEYRKAVESDDTLTWKAQLGTSATSFTFFAGAQLPMFIMVEDIGGYLL